MNYSLTVFNSIFDNKTDKRFNYDSWEKFEKVLYTLSDKKGYKAKRGERVKNASPLISPAIYVSETTRANANVTAWAGWAALDVDAYTGKYEHIAGRLGPYYTVCYSTASCTKENIKFRIVLPLTCHISADKIRHFWYALNKEFDQAGDEQTKDLSRMYYVPAKYPKAFNFIFTTKGAIMNPHELMAKHAFSERTGASFLDRLPPKMKEAIVANRKESMTNRDVHWSSYRDCPFLNKQLVINYKSIAGIDGSGRYAMIFKIMTSIACSAVKRRYPITSGEVAELVRQLDRDSSRIYQNRPLTTEADRAIEYAYKTVTF